MAIFHIARDRHYYVRDGYYLTIDGNEEFHPKTLQTNGSADSVFTWANFSDGEKLPKHLYYALIVEGGLTNDYLQRNPPSIVSIPKALRKVARDFCRQPRVQEFRSSHNVQSANCVMHYINKMIECTKGCQSPCGDSVPGMLKLEWASNLAIYGKMQDKLSQRHQTNPRAQGKFKDLPVNPDGKLMKITDYCLAETGCAWKKPHKKALLSDFEIKVKILVDKGMRKQISKQLDDCRAKYFEAKRILGS